MKFKLCLCNINYVCFSKEIYFFFPFPLGFVGAPLVGSFSIVLVSDSSSFAFCLLRPKGVFALVLFKIKGYNSYFRGKL